MGFFKLHFEFKQIEVLSVRDKFQKCFNSPNFPRCKCGEFCKFLRSDLHNRGKKSTMTDPVGNFCTLFSENLGNFKTVKTEISKKCKCKLFSSKLIRKNNFRVGVT